MTYPSRQLSVAINRPASDVYEFAANPRNLPQWASGLSRSSMIQSGDEWLADSPMGKVSIKFVERNRLGVLDHDVTLPSGECVHNPLRVVKNGAGSEVIFTLYHLPQASDAAFEQDARMVLADLQKLKALLEKA
ncbi:MAG: SRPBCC family protein [Steroidobacteraceae bacterium]